MTILTITIAVITLLGLYNFFKGILRLKRRQPIRAMAQSSTGALFLALSALGWAVGSNLLTYHRLTYEQPIADLSFQKIAPQKYKAIVTYSKGGIEKTYELHGDEWQMDARVMKWEYWANVIGFNSAYRLDRISGRFRDLNQARTKKPSIFALTADRGIDVWKWAKESPWINFIDTDYGSAAYMPMADGVSYQVSISQSGMIVRPSNTKAKDAIKNWN